MLQVAAPGRWLPGARPGRLDVPVPPARPKPCRPFTLDNGREKSKYDNLIRIIRLLAILFEKVMI
jgi:hypothetical protein